MVSPGRALASALVSLLADLTSTPPDAAHGLVAWVRALTRGDAGIREAGAAGSVPPGEPQPASIKARRVRVAAGTLARRRRFTAGRPPGTRGRRHHERCRWVVRARGGRERDPWWRLTIRARPIPRPPCR